MRFIQDGPDLPDELVVARDAGQVIFFCGAGVSQANARLPNFPTLAETVLLSLGSAEDSPARRLFEASQLSETVTKLTGLVATDRIFGLLEQEFEVHDVRAAVAQALQPPPGVCLDAHRTILDLARDQIGVVRLVTTNFDRLFEECDASLKSYNPPHLPDPLRDRDFRGIIHIHGRVDQHYIKACDDELILSSADFGRAYLSEGWAATYIRALLQRFRVVFVGYSADDPPVQYLLEAHSRSGSRLGGLYAFQDSSVDQAPQRWLQKGVRPIPYNPGNQHSTLWKTLRAWAERARDPDSWHRGLLKRAVKGPETMKPFERGMISHLAATRSGASWLAQGTPMLPATWLCVLDPKRRYAAPDRLAPRGDAEEVFDPFGAFCIDTDKAPALTDPDDLRGKRKVPDDAWDAFVSSADDRVGLAPEAVAKVRGQNPGDVALPPRLTHLGTFVSRVAHQPAALWWAAHQAGLHPAIRHQIEWALNVGSADFPPSVLKGWRLLFASWDEPTSAQGHRPFTIMQRAGREGWTFGLVREVMETFRPILVVKAARGRQALFSKLDLSLDEIVHADVNYPEQHATITIPSNFLAYAINLLRGLLEHAIVLEREIDKDAVVWFDATRPQDGQEVDADAYGLTGLLAKFVGLMCRLVVEDLPAAKAEFIRWQPDPDDIFMRLRIWGASQSALLSASEAAEVFRSTSDEHFWTRRHGRDLLYAIRDRWSELDVRDRIYLETRLLKGDARRESNVEARSYQVLCRLQWLADQGVKFMSDMAPEIVFLRTQCLSWQPSFASDAVSFQVGQANFIKQDLDPSDLVGVPISEIIDTSAEISRPDLRARVEKLPFRGLAEAKPVRALSALTRLQRDGRFDARGWSTILTVSHNRTKSERFLLVIGKRLSQAKNGDLSTILHPFASWLRDNAVPLLEKLPGVFTTAWTTLLAAARVDPPTTRPRRPRFNWLDDALNSPVGHMADAAFKDPAQSQFISGGGLPDTWKSRAFDLLSLPGTYRQQAIAKICRILSWLYDIDPVWTENNLVCLIDNSDEDADAFWCGYLSSGRMPQRELFKRVKAPFLALAKSNADFEHSTRLAALLLVGWANDGGEPPALISNLELRALLIQSREELRTRMLWLIHRWIGEGQGQWSEKVFQFLAEVWPVQKAVKSAASTRALLDVIVSLPDRFPELVAVVLPRLTVIESGTVNVARSRADERALLVGHPDAFLDVLWVILSENAHEWPYHTGELLADLRDQSAIRHDWRLLELQRREQLR